MVELLSPVGNFECLKAAVQNGADAVYFGGSMFSARAFAENFDADTLKEAIKYAKLRGVKTNLTLNTLLKNDELEDAFLLAKQAYEYGIDTIIVQDLGLADLLIKSFPDLAIHSSTQMSIHNLEGVLKLQNLGFKRVVLSRELSLHEIEYICKNSKIEIECFIHGALCISYSGQCLFSSMVGGRSGNRGKCAQSCRLPYELLENDKKIDSGYLLSTRDLCGLKFLPDLISSGVTSFKIEGRMKSSEYVATVTRIYRKYIDLANNCLQSGKMEDYIIDPQDEKELLQVFNRGNFSDGHLENTPNKNLIYKEKPNNMGMFLGIVQKYNPTKGHITVKLNEPIEIGDTISLQNETGTYTISELLQKNQNIKETKIGDIVTIGRMKGNIKSGDKIYKLSSKKLSKCAKESFSSENRKILLNAFISIKKDTPISIEVTAINNAPKIYKNMNIKCTLPKAIPIAAQNRPLEAENVILQITKTHNTPYQFKNVKIDIDDNLFLPKISMLNELRRTALEKVEDFACRNIVRYSAAVYPAVFPTTVNSPNENKTKNSKAKISVLLNTLQNTFDYEKLDTTISNIYIPLKYFSMNSYESIIKPLTEQFNVYIYMPTIVRSNYRNLLIANIEATLEKYNIKGFVISNIGNIELLEKIGIDFSKYEIIGNYTLNVYNTHTIDKLKNLGIHKFTPSPELDKNSMLDLCNPTILEKEIIVYGKLPLMHTHYCLLGKSNLCYPECKAKCNSGNKYYLQDRLHMKFRILPDNIQTVTTIFNCKTLSIIPSDFLADSVRIDILDEDVSEINRIVDMVSRGQRFEGRDFTNGNLNREI